MAKDPYDEVSAIDMDSIHESDNDGKGQLTAGKGRESFQVASFWKSQVEGFDQANSRYRKRGNMVLKRYRDERNRMDEEGSRRMNVLWANVQIMMPAIYSKCPVPVVDRKFLDRDPTGRLSSQMLERTLINELEGSGFHLAIKKAVKDRLLPGKGQVWARYVPEIGQGESLPGPTKNAIEDGLVKIGQENDDDSFEDETPEEQKLEDTDEVVIAEKIEIDYIDWDDFKYFPVKARSWEEVQAVCKKVHISKKEARDFFGDEIGKHLKPDTEPRVTGQTERQTYAETSAFQDMNERNIVVFEIWNKSDKRVYWVSTGYEYLCKVMDDPLGLTGFFPCPPMLVATNTNDTLIPVPDYLEWQDQAIQIDELTQRIAMLTKACKVAGVYAANNTAVGRIFNESIENELIPVDSWAAFAEAGGLKGVLDFLPLDTIQACIETLTKVREQAKIDLDQLTGISDVVRGTSDSRETLGGLRLKNNNAGTRLSDTQEDVSTFCRNTIKIMAEIICKHFDDQTIIESSGILYEDALQPDTVMREFQDNVSKNAPKPQNNQPPGQQGPGTPPQPQGPPQMAPPGGGASPPNPGAANNVVPFPGGQAPHPQMGQGAPMQMPPQPLMPPPPLPDPQALVMMKVDKAIKLLRKDVTRGYRIDIEIDSTIFGDKAQERADAVEFLQALGGYMMQAEKAIQLPESLPLFARALQWGVRKSRTGRDLEAEIDNFAQMMIKKSKDMIDNPQPSPDEKKAQQEMQLKQADAQMQMANDQRAAQMQQENDMRDSKMQQDKNNMEVQKAQMEFQMEQERMEMEREKMRMELEIAREKHRMEMQKMQADIHMKGQEMAMDQQHMQTEAHIEHQKGQMELQQSHQEHQQNMMVREKEHEMTQKEMATKEKHMNVQAKHKAAEQNMKHKEAMKPKPKAAGAKK